MLDASGAIVSALSLTRFLFVCFCVLLRFRKEPGNHGR